MGTLTVRESFAFSANLRLPKTVSTKERKRRIKQTMFELGLEHCSDTKVSAQRLLLCPYRYGLHDNFGCITRFLFPSNLNFCASNTVSFFVQRDLAIAAV